ncbi:MAG TPA: UDP-3-O-(3-hydroxymyristoyl)glucosamine N-acyltransferase [Polyangiaceae bacterium]|nr:UDP-3-O-(3-hydroxymyristoyl)glucosamine N-acyltransferase [Polyangiaceae bacterium]
MSDAGGPGVPLPGGPLVAELAERLGGEPDGPCRGRALRWVVPPEGEHDGSCLVPLWTSRHLERVRKSDAVVLTTPQLGARLSPGARWLHEHPLFALSELLSPFDRAVEGPRSLAYVEAGAELHPTAELGPFAVVRAGARVGEGCSIGAHAVIYPRVTLGRRVVVGPGAVLGRPGFGWANGPGGALRRVPHLGGVVIGDEVDIGPGATVDAGTLTPTRVGRGAKLDAHVHVAHNVQIGPGALVAAQSGFAGSVELGARALVGGQVGVADHVRVGEGARLAAKAGVVGNIPPFAAVAGYPAVPRWQWLRAMARLFGRRP